ncbi:hypothetical protein V5F62_12385 [Xanthobacter sp. VTT E-85237]
MDRPLTLQTAGIARTHERRHPSAGADSVILLLPRVMVMKPL